MGIGESVFSALFVMLVVFLVLVVLWLLIRAFSVLVSVIEGKGKSADNGNSST
jgi:Na+-transporting methylmalonyl-CoA/oxaloacetate decarboxylase gamma subunit